MSTLSLSKIVLFILLLVPSSPSKRPFEHKVEVDLIEVNSLYDDYGFHRLTQTIYYRWNRQLRKFKIVSWRLNNEVMVKDDEHKVKWLKEQNERNEKLKLNFRKTQRELENHYHGKYDPIPGTNFPIKQRDKWVDIFYKNKIRVVITAKIFRETHSFIDPETENKKIFPEKTRDGLGIVKKKDDELSMVERAIQSLNQIHDRMER